MAMGIAIMGGLILSTFLTLIVAAIFEYIDMVREWIESKFRPTYDITLKDPTEQGDRENRA